MTKRLIGLTGNIATGKSTVAALLRDLNAVVIDADLIARDVVKPGQPTLAAIVDTFGSAMLLPDGTLNRKALGALVFNAPDRLRRLEEVMQPGIRAALQHAIDTLPPDRVGVLEAIRLFEGGWDAQCDSIWVTTCPPEVQVQRLMHYRQSSENEAKSRVTAQHAQQDKLAKADVIINTNAGLDDIKNAVMTNWQRYIEQSR